MTVKAPLRKSPLHRVTRELGATTAAHHGWEVATCFSTPEAEAEVIRTGVGLADVSWQGKLEVKGQEEFLRALSVREAEVWQVARGHLLITCDPSNKEAISEAVTLQFARVETANSSSTQCLHLIDVTSVYTGLLLAGPQSREVLQRLTSPNISDAALTNGSCISARVAGLHTRVLRRDLEMVLAYWLFVGTEYAGYAWNTILHAGGQFGIMPVGSDAVHHVRGGDR